jgi:hypothetical protein
MPYPDPIWERLAVDKKQHSEAGIHKDLVDLWHRDVQLADPNMRQSQIQQDMHILRDYGIAEKQLTAAGFPETKHLLDVMTQIDANQKMETRKSMPGVKLDAQEKTFIGMMERSIADGNLQTLSIDALSFQDKPGEFEKLAKVVGEDMKKFGVDISTFKGNGGLPGHFEDYAGMDVHIKDKDGQSLNYSVSTSYVRGHEAKIQDKTGKVISSTPSDQSIESPYIEQVAKQVSKSI